MKGIFRPKNVSKYRGDPSNIVFRSSWEFTCMSRFDNNPNVLEWSSEEVVIPYRTVLDEAAEVKNRSHRKKWHRYFVDFAVKVKDRSGTVHKYLIEVKPLKETVEPKRSDFKSERSFRKAERTWIINKAKWKAAKEWAEDRGMKFKIFTEKNIYGK